MRRCFTFALVVVITSCAVHIDRFCPLFNLPPSLLSFRVLFLTLFSWSFYSSSLAKYYCSSCLALTGFASAILKCPPDSSENPLKDSTSKLDPSIN